MGLKMNKKIRILRAAGIVVLISVVVVSMFAYQNMNYDILNEKFLEKSGYALGFTEDIAKLDDDSRVYYIEAGQWSGTSLLHGQQVNCYDYANVLPKLVKKFHIYALDYYGHGHSSKNPDKYNAVEIGNDIIWFLEHVIKEKVYISGHSSGALLAAYVSPSAGPYYRDCP